MADARRYTPRGRTVRESAAERAGRDPFRPALQVLAGGRSDQSRRAEGRRGDQGRRAAEEGRADRGRSTADRGRATTDRGRATPDRGRGASDRGQGTADRARGTADRGRATGGTRGTGRAAGSNRSARVGAQRPPVRPKINRGLAPPRPGRPQRRLRVATVLALALFTLIGGRLVVLQFTDARAYAADALEQRLKREVIPAPRGSILDADGKPLAHSVEARYIYADPTQVQDVEATADALMPVLGQLGVSRSELVPKLAPHKHKNGTNVQFEYLARRVDVELGDAVVALNLAGVRVARDERREVPGHDLAASVIGFTGRDLKGLTGLEQKYDEQLRGEDGLRVFESGQGKLDREIPGSLHQARPARPGSSLQLTINRFVQFRVQQILAARLQAVKASIGAAVVMDVKTGEVIAQASFPGYDAADPPADSELWLDTSSGMLVDPGSTHKAIVMGAALQEGKIVPTTSVFVGPKIVKGDREFVDSVNKQTKETPVTIAGIMAYSSNIGTIRVADALGKDKVYEYQRRFGLGEPTGEGLPGEVAGLVREPKDWYGSSHGTIPIGNGVSTTPLQMAAAYAAIANDGVWVQPRLVSGLIGPDGKLAKAPPPLTRKVLDPQHARELRELLEAPVAVKGGTGNQAAIEGYRVAGKTGTGGRVVDGKYTEGYVASFIGMAPADAPRYVVAVYAYGLDITGASMAPAFREMMQFMLIRYGVPPTGAPAPVFQVYPPA
ncbi:cell division protein [Virgisporangium ochraceum]|uniref:Cell division protein n=1 Tax=Virgisporangium ochraceum TaxID=65505 RepID=A0A8J3ZTC3_9ACTN|nr:cell division protein [Virgisporangium ochraceum]